MRYSTKLRSFASLLLIVCLLAVPLTALAKGKGDKHYKLGLQYESAQQWEKAAQEFTMAVAAEPGNLEYQLHYRRAIFNASQAYMQQGRALAEQRDYVGGYNAFRQAYGYDPVNQLAASEMERMLRLQAEKEGNVGPADNGSNTQGASSSVTQSDGTGGTPPSPTINSNPQDVATSAGTEKLRVINFSGDLKSFIRKLADELELNVVFDRQSFSQPRNIEVNLHNITTARALDYIFMQEGLFFQKLDRRTILVADQTRRPQYQQLVIRTFYLSNIDPQDARNLITAAIPPSQGRPQPIVFPDKATNSLTVRDTSENINLIGQILQSIDKDRAEVVMDVNIYEVSRTDLFQLGNQIGTGEAGKVFTLGGTSGLNIVGGSTQVANQVFGALAPTALGAALLIPPTTLNAFQRKDHTKLIASTQVHAFNGEESSARIGQRVPVQTAQTYPFGFNSGNNTTTTTGGLTQFPSGGFPVINYEPTGLTLKFTPQVFPNLDVQVKMSIESKDVQNPGSATPTFTERTISGTARIQNNRTMMLASVAQDRQSNGRQGLPILGLIPVLGRFFTAPRTDNAQTDIVIAVTPRVLRAPAVTPDDERQRPSGTLSSPTSGSLEAMIQEDDRDNRIAAARRIPKNVTVQLPDVDPPAYVPAPQPLASGNNTSAANSVAASNNSTATSVSQKIEASAPQPIETSAAKTLTPTLVNLAANASPMPDPATQGSVSPTIASRPTDPASALKSLLSNMEEPPAYVPAPKALSNALTATPSSTSEATARVKGPDDLSAPEEIQPAALKENQPTTTTTTTAPAPAVKVSSAERAMKLIAGNTPSTNAVELYLVPSSTEMRVGERQRLALALATSTPLNMATIKLQFDPRFIKVSGVSTEGSMFKDALAAPMVAQSVDPKGTLFVSIVPPKGATMLTGTNVLFFVDIEAVGVGDTALSFDQDTINLVAADGRGLVLQLLPGRVSVKQ
ncbi:MAG: secretin N-terminal domain-containing protein [Pyrinomonadaceae bacterium]